MRFVILTVLIGSSGRSRSLYQGLSAAVVASGEAELVVLRQSIANSEDYVRRMKVDGILVAAWDKSEADAAMRCAPVVVNSIEMPEPQMSTVSADNFRAGEMAAESLVGRGLKTLLFVTPKMVADAPIRYAGFKSAGERLGARVEAVLVPDVYLMDKREDVTNMLAGKLRGMSLPVGVLGFNDMVGIAVLRMARVVGMSVPGDLFVVGMDDSVDECNSIRPALSSVNMNYRQVGKRGGEVILERLRSGRSNFEPEMHMEQIQPVGVVERGSTDGVVAADPVLQAAMRYLRENALRVVTPMEIAEKVGRSRRWLDGAMKEAFGTTAADEVTARRLEHAATLMLEPQAGLADVSRACGYKAVSHFCRAFKKKYGTTPTQWRQGRSQ